MLIETFTFYCHFTEPALLPAFKGSTLRGSFGHALKQVCCALRRNECGNCLLAATCCYSLIFESEKIDRNSAGFKLRLAARPHPYVLRPPFDEKRQYEMDERFSFQLLFFGPAVRFRPQIVYAAILMGEGGLGKNNSGRFVVDSITAGHKRIYDGQGKSLSMEETAEALDLRATGQTATKIRLELLTPLRVKKDNRFAAKLPFSTLVRAAMRRVAALESAYANDEPSVNYRDLTRLAESVAVAEDRTVWRDITRYSNRQGSSMQIGGMVGSIDYEGEIGPFLPFLRYCERVHLGKQTAFGLGQIRVRTP